MADVRVSLDGPRDPQGVVEVDGHNIIKHLRSLRFTADPGEPPRFLVEVLPTQRAELEVLGAQVTYVVLDDVAGWLGSINPKLLERAALEGAGMGDAASSTELILRELVRMAEGLKE